MSTHAYHDLYEADAYYLSAPKAVKPKKRSGFGPPTPIPLPPIPLPYESMTVDQIAELPVRAMAERQAHLYLWTINAYIEDAYEIARCWGFRPSTLLTWAKPVIGGGLGGCYRISTEHVLFCRRGILHATAQIGSTWFDWPRQNGHSRKPEAFLDLVETVSPAPRLELFARRQRLGWDTWGDEALEPVEMRS